MATTEKTSTDRMGARVERGGRKMANDGRTNAQRIARVTGVRFIITFITAIPALLLFGPVLNDNGYITGAGADNRVFLGALLELILIIANIGTAVVLFPLLKRQNESVALGFVTARVV